MLTCLYDVVGYALIGFMCFMCLFPCYMVISLSSHAYMLGFMFFQVYVLSFHMFTCTFLCLYAQIYVFTCLCAWIYVLCMLYVIFHMFVCSKPCSSCHVLLQPFCSFVSTKHQDPYQRVWIIPICMSMLAYFYALCLCQPFLFQALPCSMPLAGLWLYGYICHPQGLVWMQPFRMYHHNVGCFVHTFSLSRSMG